MCVSPSSFRSQINELQRSYTVSGVTTIESLLYTYFTSGSASGYLQSVLYRTQVGGGSWTPVEQAVYGYYGASDSNGSLNDLQSAAQQIPDGMGGWNTIAVDYYRYWLAGSSTGFAHGLKMHFGPEAYRLIFNAGINLTTASDATVLPYADHYFEYDPTTWSVTEEIAAVCASCTGGGTTSDSFAYTANPSYPGNGFNIWKIKTAQTLPDSSQIVVYSNYAGLPMLTVNIDSTGSNMWGTFRRYASNGQLMWEAQPSAVALPASLSTLEAYSDLLHFNTGTGLYQYLNDSTGLINGTTYDANLNVATTTVQQGQSGSPILMASFTYTSNTDSSGNVIYPVATSVTYPSASNPAITITTSYAYTFYTGINLMSQRTTTPPVISSGQNGSGTTYTIVEDFDAYGNLTERTDERGIANNFTNDVVMSRVTEQVLNYQSGITQPGVNVTTDFTYDDWGRLIQTLGPSHTVVLSGTATTVQPVTWNVYNQSAQPTSGQWAVDSTWTGQGYFDGTNYTLIDPVTINNMDKDGRSTDQIASVRSTGSGALSPTDTFNQTDWQTWSSTQYSPMTSTTSTPPTVAHQMISQRVYFLIPSSGTGTEGTNYGETDFGYDALERRNRVVAPGGTITRTVWTCPQWVLSVWVGTDDNGATDSDPTGGGAAGNNMVIVTLNQYDGGSDGGDGNLTQQTQYVSATSGDTRVTSFGYDFRDRRIGMTDALGVYTVYTVDNMDRQTQIQRYASLGGNLINQGATNYDDRSRVYQQITYAVDPGTGTVGNALTGNMWYDPSGNLLQQIGVGAGQVFSKSQYNGVNWAIASYSGYNTSGTSYSQAQTVANDTIVGQTQNTFDEVGNIVSQASFQRLNDATGVGALTSGTQPEARVSYSATWFDGIDRVMARANYGAIASFTRPSTPPSSSSTLLVSMAAYDNAGRIYEITDPNGIVTEVSYDDAGRKTETIEDNGGLNRTTQSTYTLDNLTATLTAVNATTGNQTTTYTYGTTLSTSGVARNDLLASTTYPDSVSGSDVVAYTYNRVGQTATTTDQRGTVRTFYYDKLGRLTDDAVSTVGSATDNAVLRISRAYEVRGMVQTVTSYDNATPGSGTVVNQVESTYNDFGQLIEDQQDHGGSVSGSSPKVQYGYDSGGSGTNEIRPVSLTYPNSRDITYDYGTSGAMNDLLNRVDTIQDTTSGTTNLASYVYLGAGTVIRINYPQPQVWLDLWGGTSGVFTGFDQFGRIINRQWQNYNTSTNLDQYQYGYDQNSNRIWKANVIGTPVVTGGLDEYYTYDNLNRLTEMQRGTLNGGKTGITGTPTREMGYTLDPTSNWSTYLTKTAGTTDLNQGRTSNTVNEITAISASGGTPVWATPAYDAAGNTTAFPQQANPTLSFTAVYDAWNRMVEISIGATPVVQYEYDGRNWRIVRLAYTSGVLSETRHFYFTASGRDIEQRVGTATTADQQNVWGIRYINELVCRDDATPQRLYVCQDTIYNVTALIDSSSGGVVERFLYDPYGGQTVLTASWAATADAYNWMYTFQGGLFDEASGLMKFGVRDYTSLLGRWEQRDPTGYVDGPSLYEGLASNPANMVDPSGLQFFDEPIDLSLDVKPNKTKTSKSTTKTTSETTFQFDTVVQKSFETDNIEVFFLKKSCAFSFEADFGLRETTLTTRTTTTTTTTTTYGEINLLINAKLNLVPDIDITVYNKTRLDANFDTPTTKVTGNQTVGVREQFKSLKIDNLNFEARQEYQVENLTSTTWTGSRRYIFWGGLCDKNIEFLVGVEHDAQVDQTWLRGQVSFKF